MLGLLVETCQDDTQLIQPFGTIREVKHVSKYQCKFLKFQSKSWSRSVVSRCPIPEVLWTPHCLQEDANGLANCDNKQPIIYCHRDEAATSQVWRNRVRRYSVFHLISSWWRTLSMKTLWASRSCDWDNARKDQGRSIASGMQAMKAENWKLGGFALWDWLPSRNVPRVAHFRYGHEFRRHTHAYVLGNDPQPMVGQGCHLYATYVRNALHSSTSLQNSFT